VSRVVWAGEGRHDRGKLIELRNIIENAAPPAITSHRSALRTMTAKEIDTLRYGFYYDISKRNQWTPRAIFNRDEAKALALY
jgi:hypothetical protein